jgi:alpha-tubulin suppressor-like RCC1 family protein
LYDVLNPLESKPTLVEGLEVLESGIAQVAVTDDATFVLTKAGLVYGWGTFVVSRQHSTSFSLTNQKNKLMNGH